jgi:hypothetical protein
MSIQYKLSQLHWITLKLDLHTLVILRVFPKYIFVMQTGFNYFKLHYKIQISKEYNSNIFHILKKEWSLITEIKT